MKTLSNIIAVALVLFGAWALSTLPLPENPTGTEKALPIIGAAAIIIAIVIGIRNWKK